MSAYGGDYPNQVVGLAPSGGIWHYEVNYAIYFGARAVVEINK